MPDKPEDEIQATMPLTIVPIYPAVAIPSFYANYVGVITTPEEVYLEVAQIQPQTVDGASGSAKASVVARIILSRAHAVRLQEALGRSAGFTQEQKENAQ